MKAVNREPETSLKFPASSFLGAADFIYVSPNHRGQLSGSGNRGDGLINGKKKQMNV